MSVHTHVSFPLCPCALERPECTEPRSSRAPYAAPAPTPPYPAQRHNLTFEIDCFLKYLCNGYRLLVWCTYSIIKEHTSTGAAIAYRYVTFERVHVEVRGGAARRHEPLVELHVGGGVGGSQSLVVFILLPLREVGVAVRARTVA